MRLRELAINGLKRGGMLTLDLTPLLYLHGRNGVGKSRAFDALQLLINGYHPDLPHTGDGVMRLSDGDELVVSATVEDAMGRLWSVGRRWLREIVSRGKDKGGIKISPPEVWAQCAGEMRFEKKEAEAKIKELLGSPSFVDLTALTDKTDTGRRDAIFRIGAEGAKWTAEVINAHLKDERCTGVKPWNGISPLYDWLSGEVEAQKERTKAARALVAQRREAAAKLGEDSEGVEPADVGVLRRAHEQAQADARKVHADWSRATTQARSEVDRVASLHRQRTIDQAELATVKAEIERVSSATATDEIARLRGELMDLEEGWGDDAIPGLTDALTQAEREAEEAKQTKAQAATTLDEAKKARQRAADDEQERAEERRVQDEVIRSAILKRDFAQSRLDEARKLLASLNTDSFDDPACPYCTQPIPVTVLAKLQAPITQAEQELREAEEEVEQAWVKVEQAWVKAKPASDRLTKRANELTTATDALRQAEEAEREAVNCWSRCLTDAENKTAELTSARSWLKDATDKATALKNRIEVLEAQGDTGTQAQLATLRERERNITALLNVIPFPMSAVVATLQETERRAEQEKAEADGRATAAFDELKREEEKLTLFREAARIRQELVDAQTDLKEQERVEKAVGPKGLMGRIVASIIEPLEAAVNDCIEGLNHGAFKIRMQDARENEVFHMGLEAADGTFRPIETLSQGERGAVHAAVLVGLATLGKAPWRVVLADHMERLDLDRRTAFLSQLATLKRAGKVDQVLAAGCSDIIPDSRDFTLNIMES